MFQKHFNKVHILRTVTAVLQSEPKGNQTVSSEMSCLSCQGTCVPCVPTKRPLLLKMSIWEMCCGQYLSGRIKLTWSSTASAKPLEIPNGLAFTGNPHIYRGVQLTYIDRYPVRGKLRRKVSRLQVFFPMSFELTCSHQQILNRLISAPETASC